ncbi:biotin--[acetyl-CoA-carboxylase] ligase [Anatilimnocola floriformis]|uniref:biotin--[acetyl-CoA-carboxylase] ligase n=1 Tax=Anatilimnocola floriformis TaxID=2948575 RepID=UPI0020C4940A|nr:biotin--[acetyl-CoA-carboxylase] ligase [Anatilimnocola floriformis]
MRKNELASLAAHPWIQRLEFTQSLGSTNDQATQLAAEEFLACPALVWAEEQTAGRGRGGNRWWSSRGGLMFSVILSGEGSAPANWSGYSLTAGLAICEALAAEIPAVDFAVKWPNDVYADGRKICGILIESPAQARGRLIVGIGVNVNNSFADAPEELSSTATALCDLDGQQRSLSAVLFEILSRLEHCWQRLAAEGFAALREHWQERASLTGRTVTLQVGRTQHVGRCLGIDADGSLLLHTERGREAFAAGSVVSFE